MSNYDSVDLDWTWDGDFLIGPDGDLKDTSDDLIRSLENEIRTIVKSEFGDWQKHPRLGAGLEEFRGEPNTRETGDRIRQRVSSRLQANNLVKGPDLQVRVVPVHVNQVLIAITIQADATPGNRLQLGEPVVINLIYDSSEKEIFFLPPNQKERDSFFRSP